MNHIFKLWGLSVLIASCQTIPKYNAHLDKSISAKKIRKDIKRAEERLFTMHPDIDWYIPKDSLHFKFDSLTNSINTAMKPREVYDKLAPVVTAIKQAHTRVLFPAYKSTKDEQKALEGTKGPLSQLKVYADRGEIYLQSDSSANENKIASNSKITSINGVLLHKWYDTLANTLTPDGYDRNFKDYYITNRFSSYFTEYHGIQDSIVIKYIKPIENNLENQRTKRINAIHDSLFTTTIYRQSKQYVDSVAKIKHRTDSIASTAKSDTTIDKKAQAALNKQKNKEKLLWGYNAKNKQWAKELKLVDSQTALFTIKNFSEGQPSKVYDVVFDSLAKSNINNLIIDVRGNPGGRLSELHYLNTYLSDQDSVSTVKENTVINKRNALSIWTYYSLPKWSYPFASPFLAYNAIKNLLTLQKNENGTYFYQLKEAKPTKRKENAFDGNIIIWTDEGTFSAAAILASNLKEQKNVTNIGRETGGAHNGTVAGRLPVIKLRHSKLKVRIGTMNIIPENNKGTFGRGVKPDIHYRPENLILKSDSTLLEKSVSILKTKS